mmetsp:Transcript_67245/g.154050  ORF Transcript_67245/g.154050 Transcript_67245/m.154050 type:complete len:243 (-) Transcript_67245:183-911(-)
MRKKKTYIYSARKDRKIQPEPSLVRAMESRPRPPVDLSPLGTSGHLLQLDRVVLVRGWDESLHLRLPVGEGERLALAGAPLGVVLLYGRMLDVIRARARGGLRLGCCLGRVLLPAEGCGRCDMPIQLIPKLLNVVLARCRGSTAHGHGIVQEGTLRTSCTLAEQSPWLHDVARGQGQLLGDLLLLVVTRWRHFVDEIQLALLATGKLVPEALRRFVHPSRTLFSGVRPVGVAQILAGPRHFS